VRDESSLTLLDLFRPQHERSVSLIVRGIGQKAFDAAYARGRAMTIDEGVAFAVEDRQLRKPARPPPLGLRPLRSSRARAWNGSWNGAPGHPGTASAIRGITRGISTASAFSGRRRSYGKEKVYGSIP